MKKSAIFSFFGGLAFVLFVPQGPLRASDDGDCAGALMAFAVTSLSDGEFFLSACDPATAVMTVEVPNTIPTDAGCRWFWIVVRNILSVYPRFRMEFLPPENGWIPVPKGMPAPTLQDAVRMTEDSGYLPVLEDSINNEDPGVSEAEMEFVDGYSTVHDFFPD